MTRRPGLLLLCIACVATTALSSLSALAEQPGGAAPDPQVIRQREQQRVTCLISGDYDGLDKMTSPTLSYSHSNAAIDTKERWLASLRGGQVKFSKLVHRDAEVRFVTPEVAIINSLPDVEVTVGGQLQRMTLRVTIVYVLKNGTWLFEAWQATRRPD